MSRLQKKKNHLFFSLSLALFLLLLFQWNLATYNFIPSPNQVTNEKELERILSKTKNNKNLLIPTGLEIFSIKFSDRYTVMVGGFLWQIYDKNTPNWAKGGVLFPESISSSTRLVFEEKSEENKTIKVWRFYTSLRQNLDYFEYPFDNKLIHLRMWPKNYHKNIFLTPDLSSYKDTSMKTSFGIDNSITLKPYSIQETYFTFERKEYDSSLGLHHISKKIHEPELHFNVEIKRDIYSTVVGNIIPILTIWSALYFLLHLYSAKIIQINSLFSSYIGLLFATVLSHNQLRGKLVNVNFVQLEYLHIATYLIILTLLYFLLSFEIRDKRKKESKIFNLKNYLLFYWPILLGIVNCFTYISLFPPF